MLINNIDFINIFEQKLETYTGFKYAVCTDCCTNAILLSLSAKIYLNEFNKNDVLNITKYTYMSIPMTLLNYGYKINFIDNKWNKFYEIGNTNIFDAATDMHENMVNDYNDDALVCISFQQKKRLSLGRGGAILFNSVKYLELLCRLRYDGRNPYISDKDEIENNSNDIICGYHCYMEPDKAALGILKINQPQLLQPYKQYSYKDYNNVSKLPIFKTYEK